MARNSLPSDISSSDGQVSRINPAVPAISSGRRPIRSDSAPANGTATATTARHTVDATNDCTFVKCSVVCR
nr:hypothetical protein [Amycolatopsis methanolica]